MLREAPAVRQLLPVLIFLLLIGSLLMGPAYPVLLLIPFFYLSACYVLSFGAALMDGLGLKGGLATALLAAVMHVGFGFGYLNGLLLSASGKAR